MKHLDVAFATYEGGEQATVRAGFRGAERIVPPAGDDYAFNRDIWMHEVSVYVSPGGRSVRLFIDGNEIEWPQ